MKFQLFNNIPTNSGAFPEAMNVDAPENHNFSNSNHEAIDFEAPTQPDPFASQPMTQLDAIEAMDFSAPEPVIKPWAKLIRKSDNLTYELFDQTPDESERYNLYQIGRGSACSIKLDTSIRISNKHCLLYCKMNKGVAQGQTPYLEAWVEDISANGTFINNSIRLKKNVPRLLRTGDELCFINPSLLNVGDAGVTDSDLQRNSYHVIIELPSAQSNTMGQASRTLRSQTIVRQINEKSFGRSNTVIRLLNQQRCIFDYYSFHEILGTGTSGKVHHGICKDTGKSWAIKEISLKQQMALGAPVNGKDPRSEYAQTIMKEAELLRTLQHPNIIHLEDIFSDDSHIYLVMELSSGGDLFDRISTKKRYNEDEARQVMIQLLQSIQFLHDHQIIHRDLKPENILLPSKDNDCFIKLSDFGLAKYIEQETGANTAEGALKGVKTFCGTPQYFAPEVLQRKNTVHGKGRYSFEADLWSIGVILYVLLAGQYPFPEQTLQTSIRSGKYNIKTGIWTTASNEVKDLIAKLLVVDPSKRMTAKQALQHPWILQGSHFHHLTMSHQQPPQPQLPFTPHDDTNMQISSTNGHQSSQSEPSQHSSTSNNPIGSSSSSNNSSQNLRSSQDMPPPSGILPMSPEKRKAQPPVLPPTPPSTARADAEATEDSVNSTNDSDNNNATVTPSKAGRGKRKRGANDPAETGSSTTPAAATTTPTPTRTSKRQANANANTVATSSPAQNQKERSGRRTRKTVA